MVEPDSRKNIMSLYEYFHDKFTKTHQNEMLRNGLTMLEILF